MTGANPRACRHCGRATSETSKRLYRLAEAVDPALVRTFSKVRVATLLATATDALDKLRVENERLRSEAAEQLAAIKEWVEAHTAYSEWMVHPIREDWTSGEAKARKERLEAAEAALTTLSHDEAAPRPAGYASARLKPGEY